MEKGHRKRTERKSVLRSRSEIELPEDDILETDRPHRSLPRPQEQLLIDALADVPAGKLLCNTAGRAQFAIAAAADGTRDVTCSFWDVYQRQLAQESEEAVQSTVQLNWSCEADFPAGPYNAVAICCSRRGSAEFTREILQSGHERLIDGGRLLATVDHPEDEWLHEQLQKLFAKVTRRRFPTGTLYLATRTGPLKKRKKYDFELKFRDGPRLVDLKTRPGVFSHREVDGGARALIDTMEIKSGWSVLDLGCGSGAVGLAAALREPRVSVLAVDSNPRATECARWGAEANGIKSFKAIVDAEGDEVPENEFDVVLANPPYFSQYRIAQLFLQTAAKALKPKKKAYFVTKTPDWFVEHMPKWFMNIEVVPCRDYSVVVGQKTRVL